MNRLLTDCHVDFLTKIIPIALRMAKPLWRLAILDAIKLRYDLLMKIKMCLYFVARNLINRKVF